MWSPRRTAASRFIDGTETAFDVVARIPCPTWPYCAPEAPPRRRAKLRDADQLVVGQLVYAVGNPLGLAAR